MRYANIFGILVPKFLISLAVVLSFLFVALVFRRVVLARLAQAARKSSTHWDDIMVAALRLPLLVGILAGTAEIVRRLIVLPPDWNSFVITLVRAAVIVALILFADRCLRETIEHHREQLSAFNLTRGFARVIARVVVLILGSLILLDTLNISITPLLASLGVGGLAIGLALQGTLSNLFAGIQIIGDQPLRVGDFVKLESGEQGYVTEIGWRATKIRMLPNNVVVIPNSKLADSIMTNYYLPDRELAVLVEVGVSYNSNLEEVERVTIAVAQDVQQTVTGAVASFTPFIRYHTFDSSSINFSVILRAREFVDNFLIKHEFIKRLHARYRQENIVIPWPIRTLDVPPAVLERLAPRQEANTPTVP